MAAIEDAREDSSFATRGFIRSKAEEHTLGHASRLYMTYYYYVIVRSIHVSDRPALRSRLFLTLDGLVLVRTTKTPSANTMMMSLLVDAERLLASQQEQAIRNTRGDRRIAVRTNEALNSLGGRAGGEPAATVSHQQLVCPMHSSTY